jgi:hypothetical protein
MLFDQCIVVALVIKVQLSLWLWNRFQAYVNLQFGIKCKKFKNGDPRWI